MIRILLALLFFVNYAMAGTEAIVKADIIEGIDTVKNYIGSKGHFEKSINGWAGYDSGSADPGNCTAAGFDGTIARSTLNPLSGEASLDWAKSGGVSRIGNGIKTDFSIDAKDKGGVLKVQFDYIPDSVYTDDQLAVFIYDVTNSRLIEPAPNKIKHSLVATQIQPLEFQTSIDSTSYRLCIHTIGTSTANWTMKLDSIKVSKSQNGSGVFVSDWQSYTPVWSASGTATSLGNGSTTGRWRRVGDTIEIEAAVTLGTTSTVGTLVQQLSIPSSVSVSELTALVGGSCFMYDNQSSANARAGTVQLSSGTLACYLNASGAWQATTTGWGGDGDKASFTVKYKVNGWSSNMALSSPSSASLVSMYGGGNPNSSITASPAKVTWSSSPISADTAGLWDSANNQFTVKTSGYYQVSMQTEVAGTEAVDNSLIMDLFDSTLSSVKTSGTARVMSAGISSTTVNVSRLVYLTAGNIYYFRIYSTITTPTYSAATQGTSFSISLFTGNQQIAASSGVFVEASNISGSTIPTATHTILTYPTEIEDNLGSLSSGVFTAQSPGRYSFSGTVCLNSSTTHERNWFIVKNHGSYGTLALAAAAAQYSNVSGDGELVGNRSARTFGGSLRLNSNETAVVIFWHNNGASQNLCTGAGSNKLVIQRIGL